MLWTVSLLCEERGIGVGVRHLNHVHRLQVSDCLRSCMTETEMQLIFAPLLANALLLAPITSVRPLLVVSDHFLLVPTADMMTALTLLLGLLELLLLALRQLLLALLGTPLINLLLVLLVFTKLLLKPTFYVINCFNMSFLIHDSESHILLACTLCSLIAHLCCM